jgi:ArsR family transcriptional regulator
MSNNQQLTSTSRVFAALGNPHRLRILAQLAQCCRPGPQCCGSEGELRVGEMGGGLEIAASTLSHHVKELSRAGLLCCTRRGKCVMCCASAEALAALGGFFTALAEGKAMPKTLLIPAKPK